MVERRVGGAMVGGLYVSGAQRRKAGVVSVQVWQRGMVIGSLYLKGW